MPVQVWVGACIRACLSACLRLYAVHGRSKEDTTRHQKVVSPQTLQDAQGSEAAGLEVPRHLSCNLAPSVIS